MASGSGSGLYGAPRPKSKSTAISLSSTSIHALSTEISLARSRLSSTSSLKSAPGRSRPSKTKSLFAGSNKNVSKRAVKDLADSHGGKTSEQLGGGISERDLARSRKRLKEKAKLYEAMKRGDFNDDAGEGLVDFDRKWAEHPSDEESDNGDGADEEREDDDDGDEIVEYEDEFGRTRKGKKSQVEKDKRREAAAKKAVDEETARDAVPEGLIIGNMIQTSAFTTATFSAVPTSSMLSSALPVEEEEDLETHYDANREVRTKGVGFYQFSTNSKERAGEMEELLNERKHTAEGRKMAEEKKKRRREEVEARREEVKRRRRGKVGGNWLDGFMGEIEADNGAGKEKEEKQTTE